MARKHEEKYQIPDGIPRDVNVEADINKAMAAWLDRPEARLALDYLRSITLNRVAGPEKLDSLSLSHREGQRYLLWLMEYRAVCGRRGIPSREEEIKDG